MLKKIMALALALILVFSLYGCSGQTTGDDQDAQTSTEVNNDEPSDSAEINWPKNVEIVVPGNPGGDTDFNARQFATILSQKLGANFVVSNITGGGGATASRQVMEAEPDGSAILCYHSAFVVNQLTGTTDYGFDAFDFACICAKSAGNVLTVSSSLGVNTMDELFDYAKAHPGELKIAAQVGATSYAVATLLKQAGLEVNIVDAGTASDRLTALLGGHVDIILAAYGSIKDYVTDGELIPLAMDSADGLKAGDLEIKGLKELGYDVQLPFYYFFAFPKGTDPAMVQQFSDTVKDIVENDTQYAETIGSAYYQEPTYYNKEDGLAKFDEVYKILETVDFSA